ncbi:MAG: phage tail protein [Chloroflexi bacterium]|nr:phage tail protein [Chloroflexota bacterium]MCC6894491.1 hypothetical protein [Anaerolineae bacterium]
MAALNLTKGGLAPATLTNLDTNEVVNFMFNPFEYTLSKHNTWQDKPVTGQNLPYVTFQQGGAITLKLTLHFDSQDENKDVRNYTDKLWKMVMINQSKVDAKTGKGQPPAVVFDWGKLHFKAIINDLSQQFTLFSENGIPMRCSVDISLQQYADDVNAMGEAQSGNASSLSSGTPTAPTTAVQGQRLDHIANSPNDQRKVAEKNNIDNPLNVPRGTKLKVD